MNYFEHCQSVEEAKKHYRGLIMKHHPDHAGEKGEAITAVQVSIPGLAPGMFPNWSTQYEHRPALFV
jgi:hypothetical protein